MANYYIKFRYISGRGKGVMGKAVEHAAYLHAAQMTKASGSATSDYTHKVHEVVHSEITFQEHASDWVHAVFGSDAVEKLMLENRELQSTGDMSRQRWAANVWLSQCLWNSAEDAETRLNRRPKVARIAHTIVFSLPRELSLSANIELVENFIRTNILTHGVVADWVIHDLGSGNPHCHIMVTARILAPKD